MSLLKKIGKTAAVVLISLMAALFALSVIWSDKVAGLILESLNRNFATRIETGSYRLSLIRKFPRASVELRNVLVHSSPGFEKEMFKGSGTDTLLSAKSASLVFSIAGMLRGDYTFSKIIVKSGRLNLYTDTGGHYNYDISGGKKGGGSSNFTINLKSINLSGIDLLYDDLNADLTIKGLIDNGRLKCTIKGNDFNFDGNMDVLFRLFRLHGTAIKQAIAAKIEAGVSRNPKGYFFRKSTMTIENWDFVLNGFVAADNYLDLNVSAANIDISRIINILPEKLRSSASQYHPSGNLKLDWTIKGISSRRVDPHYDLTWSLKDAHISRSGSDLRLDGFNFNGSYTNGRENRPETSTLSIDDFSAKLGSQTYRGSLRVSDFSRPGAELTFRGTLLPSELKEYFNLQNVARAGGSIAIDVKLSGNLAKKESYRFGDLFTLGSQSQAIVKNVSLVLKNRNISLLDANGTILFNETTTARDFGFSLNGNRITLNASLTDFLSWAAGNQANLGGKAFVNSSCLRPEQFFDNQDEKSAKGKNAKENAPLDLPDNILAAVDFSFDTLLYKTFKANKVRGSVVFRPGQMNFNSMNLNSQKGVISGNMSLNQHADKSFEGRGSFSVNNVDVNEAFTSFNNFGQNFLKAENLAGSLSGNISIVLPVDSMLKPDMSSLKAEGKYVISDGALKNFDPVKALSSFIELSELENIKFENLENEFFIRNNCFYIPQMDVRSTAVDLSVNGTHTFDNNYQYHVKMLLSEILSNKARRNKSLSDEFGEVEDDGLGRTSVFLKIDGKGEVVKVTYDAKATADQIRNDIRKERQTLRNILNEEYGLYKKDTVPEKKARKPRFRVTWEGTGGNTQETERPAVKKESIIRNLFKKK